MNVAELLFMLKFANWSLVVGLVFLLAPFIRAWWVAYCICNKRFPKPRQVGIALIADFWAETLLTIAMFPFAAAFAGYFWWCVLDTAMGLSR